MKHALCAAAALAVTFGATGAAFAQPDHRHDRPGDTQQQGAQYRQHPDWRKGHRMSQNDWSRGQRVDYRSHHLRAPPRGYEWREVDGNYVLAAAATGLIYSIIANAH
jgi:Ni/Co efflux regulator RcnB